MVLRTLVWTAINVVLIMVLSTVVALMLVRLRRGMRLAVMSALVLAWATPVIAATTVFQWLFQSRARRRQLAAGHARPRVLRRLHLVRATATRPSPSWSSLVVWQSVPFAALTLYAGLTTSPPSCTSRRGSTAATGWQVFSKITVPDPAAAVRADHLRWR